MTLWNPLPAAPTRRPRRLPAAAAEVLEERRLLSANPVAERETIAQATSGSGASAETVIGTDDRVRVTNTRVAPYRQVVALKMTFNGGQFIGSGILIGRRHVLTAAHCIYDPFIYGAADRVEVIPGLDGNSRPFGSATAVRLDTFKEWRQTGSPEWDMGLITLDRPIGTKTGWMDTAVWSNAQIRNARLNTAGYPGDLDPAGDTMYRTSGRARSVERNMINYAGTMDSFGGQSGSAVWINVNGRPTIAGIHAYGSAGPPNNYNSAVRLTGEKFRTVEQWMQRSNLIGWERGTADRADRTTTSGWEGLASSRRRLSELAARANGLPAAMRSVAEGRLSALFGGELDESRRPRRHEALDRVLDDLLPVVRAEDVDGLWSLLADEDFRRDLVVSGVC